MSSAETDEYERLLRLADILRASVLGRAVEDLPLCAGSRVLDAGCGAGSLLPLLAERTGPAGRVTGLDISSGLLSKAERSVAALGLEDRVSLVRGDVAGMPFEDAAFDCAVSVDCVGYPFASHPVPLLLELRRVVRPGGTVAILGWTHQQFLPGYPSLEAKLNTASSLVVHPHTAMGPRAHFMRARGWFEEAGFTGTACRSYVGDVSAPLSGVQKEAILAFFEMLWSGARGALADEERRLFDRLSSPGSGDLILDDPGFYGFFLYTCFSGMVPAE